MHRAAVPPQRRTDRADTRPPRALLLPQLLARTGNAPAVLGGMRARTRRGAIVRDRFPEQVFVDRAENFIGQFHRPSLSSAQSVNINSCHMLSRVVWRGRPRPRPLILLLPLTLARARSQLSLLRSPLRCLQRIDRRRARKSAALSWRLLRLVDHDVSAVRARNAAFNH